MWWTTVVGFGIFGVFGLVWLGFEFGFWIWF